MTNSESGGQIGDEILHAIATEYNWPDYRPRIRTTVSVDPKILAQYAGTYALAPNFDLVFTVENGQLMTQASGQPKFPVYAESETSFFLTVVEAQVEFFQERSGQGHPPGPAPGRPRHESPQKVVLSFQVALPLSPHPHLPKPGQRFSRHSPAVLLTLDPACLPSSLSPSSASPEIHPTS